MGRAKRGAGARGAAVAVVAAIAGEHRGGHDRHKPEWPAARGLALSRPHRVLGRETAVGAGAWAQLTGAGVAGAGEWTSGGSRRYRPHGIAVPSGPSVP